MLSVGSSHFDIVLEPDGRGGMKGRITDLRPPILHKEVVEMLGLYLLEKEEQDQARRDAENGG